MCTGGRAGVRYVITKFSRMDSLPNFVTQGAPLRALRARELRYDLSDLGSLILIRIISKKRTLRNRWVLALFYVSLLYLLYSSVFMVI